MSDAKTALIFAILLGISGLSFVIIDTYLWKRHLKKDDLDQRINGQMKDWHE